MDANNSFIDWFKSIVNNENNVTNKPKPTNEELMTDLTNSINELANEYMQYGIYLINCERNAKGNIKCNFKIIKENNSI